VTAIHKDLYPYQVEGAQWLSSMRNAILGDEPRVGKTAAAIAGADLISARRVLVVCPAIVRPNWEREFQRWQMLLRTTCLIMSSKDRPMADVTIVSYELTCSRPVLLALLAVDWDLLIVDECHKTKNPFALSTQVIYGGDCTAAKGLASKAKRVWLLSGTPIPNNLAEMWSHARALFPSAVKGLERYTDWVDHFCYTQEGDYGTKILGAREIEDFVDRFAPFIKRRMLKDVQPDLPPVRFSAVTVQPASVPPRLVHVDESEAVIRAALARAKLMPNADDLQAIASMDQMHLSSIHKWTGIAKAPAVAEFILREMQEEGLKKVVIFAKHTEVFDILKTTLPYCEVINGKTPNKDRQPIIDAFQGRVPGRRINALAVHLDIGSIGIDLTAASDVVFAETSWVPKDVLQAAMRCQGVNQTKPVLARIMSLKGSLDEAINETIVRKHRMISKIETRFAS
jgi:SWI/SNF-related matrix-associated actin-dependent regulator 1 of chromatin subfamily A